MVTHVNYGMLEEIQLEHIIRNLLANLRFKESSFILNYYLSYILIKYYMNSLKKSSNV